MCTRFRLAWAETDAADTKDFGLLNMPTGQATGDGHTTQHLNTQHVPKVTTGPSLPWGVNAAQIALVPLACMLLLAKIRVMMHLLAFNPVRQWHVRMRDKSPAAVPHE